MTKLSGEAVDSVKLQARVLRAELALAVQRVVTRTAIEELKMIRDRAYSAGVHSEIQGAIDRAVQAGRDKADELNSEETSDDDFY